MSSKTPSPSALKTVTPVPPVRGSEADTDISAAVLGIRAPLHPCPLTGTGIAKALLALPLISAYSITPDKLDSAPTRHTAKSRPGLFAERGGRRSPCASAAVSRPVLPGCLHETSQPPALPRPPLQTSGPPGERALGLQELPAEAMPPGELRVCRWGRATGREGSAPKKGLHRRRASTARPGAPSGRTGRGLSAALGTSPPSPPYPPT